MLLATFLLGCEGKDGAPAGESPADTAADSGPTETGSTDSEPTGTTPETWFAPAAIGFEVASGWDPTTGELVTLNLDEDSPVPPSVILRFASAEYFAESDPDVRDALECTVLARLDVAPGTFDVTGQEDGAPLEVWDAWVGTATFDAGGLEDDEPACHAIDPEAVPDGDLIGTFSGMKLGLAFGPLTEYAGVIWDPDDVAAYPETIFTQAVAINHPDGAGVSFVGHDWSSAILYQVDPETLTPVFDGDGYAVPATSRDGVGLAVGHARWLEDFPLLDLGLLKEGA